MVGRSSAEQNQGHNFRSYPVRALHWAQGADASGGIWRAGALATSRARSGAGKYDSEWHDGVFLGFSVVEVIIGAADGVHRSRDIRRVSDGECWKKDAINQCKVSFRECMSPGDGPQTEFEIPVVHRDPAEVPDIDFSSRARRLMLHPRDFEKHGFTAGCPGCIALKAGKQSRGGRHSEKCRERIEKELMKTPEGRERKERERLRREQEFERIVTEEDKRQRAQQGEQPTEEPPRSATEPPERPLPSRVFAEVDHNRPSDPIALGRYLGSQCVDISQGFGYLSW